MSTDPNKNKLFFINSHTEAELLEVQPVTRSFLQHTDLAIESLKHNCLAKHRNYNDLLKLVVYHQYLDGISETDFLEHIAHRLNMNRLPVITLIPLRQINFTNSQVMIDAYGMENDQVLTTIADDVSPFNLLIRTKSLTLTGAITPTKANGQLCDKNDVVNQSEFVLQKLDHLLDQISASRHDIVKINNWYVAGGTAEQWRHSAAVRANYYPEPGPVATGLPLESLNQQDMLIQTDCWIMTDPLGNHLVKQFSWPDGHWDWPIHLPFKHGLKCGDLVFVGGQVSMNEHAEVVDPDDMAKQSHTSMNNIARVLGEFDLTLDDIVKLNAYYKLPACINELKQSIQIRGHHLQNRQPSSMSIALKDLAYTGMLTEFEVIATTNKQGDKW